MANVMDSRRFLLKSLALIPVALPAFGLETAANTKGATVMSTSKSRIIPEDTAVLFADLQGGIVELTKTIPLDRLKKGVNSLAKLAKLFGMPAFVSGVAGNDGSAPNVIPEIAAGYGDLPMHVRTTADSFRNEGIVGAIKATGRKTLLISGVSTELAVQLPALTAADHGYKVYVVLDACGGMSDRTEQAALMRITKAGCTTVPIITLAGELAGDFRSEKAAEAIGILFDMAKP